MIVFRVAVERINGKMTPIHAEIPFQYFDGLLTLHVRRLFAFLPT
jgi:hypothetical protein